MTTPPRAICPVCEREMRVLNDGTMGPHTTGRREHWNGWSWACPGWLNKLEPKPAGGGE